MRPVKYKEKKPITNRVFYEAEAFLSCEGKLLSMKYFAPALLDATNEDKVAEVCAKFGFKHENVSPFASHIIFGHPRYLRYPWKFSESADYVPSYTSWLMEHLKVVSAQLQFYSICVSVIRNTLNGSSVSDLFELLFYALKTQQQVISTAYQKYAWIPHEDIREHKIKNALRGALKLPLTDFFRKFQEEEGIILQKEYGFSYNQSSKGKHHEYHYWNNPSAKSLALEKLWEFANAHPTDNNQYILKADASALAAMYLGILDKDMNRDLNSVEFSIDSITGKAMLVASDISVALKLWVFTQIQGRTEYRACRMCGQFFEVGSQKTQKYCRLHEKHEINYFNKKIRELQEKTLLNRD